LKNTLKVEVKQSIIIKIIFLFLIQSCTRIVPINQLTFRNCKFFLNDKLFSGNYELKKGKKYILSKVVEGKLIAEKIYVDELLRMEKKYDSCGSGTQKTFDSKGEKISEGRFKSNRKVGDWKYFISDSIYYVKF
jgi:hypothetical protein